MDIKAVGKMRARRDLGNQLVEPLYLMNAETETHSQGVICPQPVTEAGLPISSLSSSPGLCPSPAACKRRPLITRVTGEGC